MASALSAMQSSTLLTQAVIRKKVINMHNSYPAQENPPASPEVKSCPRAHQGLCNEIVICHECKDDQIKISFPHVIYGYDPSNGIINNTFWTFKNDLVPLDQLDAQIKESLPSSDYAQTPTIVLTYPWNSFSVGTRLKHLAHLDTALSYAIMHIDYAHNNVFIDFVPRENALEEIKQEPSIARKLFVKVINSLVDRVTLSGAGNVIPYVWGGSSYTHAYKDGHFSQIDGAWQREENGTPYSGYDCSELVMRMAQIAGLDFPWKTSTAIQRALKEVCSADTLEDGDLIWVPGHVMIISNLEKNELIEARSYSVGFGCVHRASLDECFEGIKTYSDLRSHHSGAVTVQFKDRSGKVLEKKHTIKLLKLM